MTITTQDCKKFIDSISPIINEKMNDKWKRVRKYKEENLVLREFENPKGRKLIIAESIADSHLFLYQLQGLVFHVPEVITDTLGSKHIGHPATENDVFTFIAECVAKDHSIVYGDFDTVVSAVDPKSWTVWASWSNKTNNFDEFLLEDFFADESNEGNLALFYKNAPPINTKDITKIFWGGMRDYDTAYRIYIFETKNQQLWLGTNNPD